MKPLKTGDPCPCCGQPIKTKDPQLLCLLTYIRDSQCNLISAAEYVHKIVLEACDGTV